MDNLADQLKELTERCVERLEELDYEQLTEFVNTRGMLIDELRKNASQLKQDPKVQAIIKYVLEQDSLIETRMRTLSTEASNYLNKVDVARTQKNAYDVQYAPDSMFFDRRK